MPDSLRNPGLDGIRGLAVALVILFHLQAVGFAGAHVGVEMFFGLSGFVIWRALMRRHMAGRAEPWSRFLLRRLLRVGPALVPVLAVTALLVTLLFLPDDRRETLIVAAAALLFAANFVLAGGEGYFAGHAVQPLLHIWSLAAEMQIYLMVPVLFSLCQRAGGRHLVVLGGLTGLVFLAGAGIGRFAPEAAYFLPVSRLWQFLAGALLATALEAGRLPRAASALPGLIGAGLIGLMLAWPDGAGWSNGRALVPVVATLGLIWSCTAPSRGGVLSARPLVALGTVSYSLYLWHLPVLVIADYVVPGRPGGLEVSLGLALSLALAALSWRFLERPFLALPAWQGREAQHQ